MDPRRAYDSGVVPPQQIERTLEWYGMVPGDEQTQTTIKIPRYHHQAPACPPRSSIHSSPHHILPCSSRWLAIRSMSSHYRSDLVPGTQVRGASATTPVLAWNSMICKRHRWLSMYAVADRKLPAFPKMANLTLLLLQHPIVLLPLSWTDSSCKRAPEQREGKKKKTNPRLQ